MSAFGVRLRAALLAGRPAHAHGAGALAPRRGEGYEFAELRGYVEGDDPRRIDWAATARAGALQTRVMLEERALTLAVAIDASGSMQVGRRKSNYELGCDAARAWYGAAADDDRCARVGSVAVVLREVRGRIGAAACAARREAAGTPFSETLRLALAALPRGTRLLLVSDFFAPDGFLALLRACVARFDLTALVARDPWHAGLPLAGFVRLRDAETGRAASAYVGAAQRRRFQAAVDERERSLCASLRRAGARVALLDAESGPECALTTALALEAR